MTTDRFFLEDYSDLQSSKVFRLQGSVHHHISRVARKRTDDEVELVSGKGFIAKGRIVTIKKYETTIEILCLDKCKKIQPHIHLVIPLLKRENDFELAIKAVTELGIDSINIMQSERAHHLNAKRLRSRMVRYRKIIVSAGVLARLYWFPAIEYLGHLSQLSNKLTDKSIVIAGLEPALNDRCYRSQITKKIELSSPDHLFMLVGPEGGWGEKDLELIKNIGSYYLQLGFNNLSSSVAAISGIAVLIRQFRSLN